MDALSALGALHELRLSGNQLVGGPEDEARFEVRYSLLLNILTITLLETPSLMLFQGAEAIACHVTSRHTARHMPLSSSQQAWPEPGIPCHAALEKSGVLERMSGPRPCCWLEQVGELASALRFTREEVAAQVAAANAKDRENSQLWEQVRMLISPRSDNGHWCRGH